MEKRNSRILMKTIIPAATFTGNKASNWNSIAENGG
jgi:hypothetical protein